MYAIRSYYVCLSSVAGIAGNMGQTNYAASKAGIIDSPGTRALPIAAKRPEIIMNPAAIADAFYYLHRQDKSFV